MIAHNTEHQLADPQATTSEPVLPWARAVSNNPHTSVDELLALILARIQHMGDGKNTQNQDFQQRIDHHLKPLLEIIYELYHQHVSADELRHVAGDLGALLAESWGQRSDALRELDAQAQNQQPWWQTRNAVVAACYADRWAGGFGGIGDRIPYLQELGITHLRLLPPFVSFGPFGDGGFSVSSYRLTDPTLGTIEELAALAQQLQTHGISLMLDVVLSRTAPDHPWAHAAARKNPFFEAFYRIQPDGPAGEATQHSVWSQGPAWERVLPWDSQDRRRVRTSEQGHQWDLDWTNPHVFVAMTGEMLHVLNLGAQVLRIGAPWQLWHPVHGTPDVLRAGRKVMRALRLITEIAAPSVALETNDPLELHIDNTGAHIAEGLDRSALIWSSMATRDVRSLAYDIQRRGGPIGETGYLQPVRNHDALQWSFADDTIMQAGLDPDAHRRFLSDFYSGRYEGSFATNPTIPSRTGQPGPPVCGTTASLAGIRHEPGPGADRVLLAHAVAFSLGGVPEIWLGDELGMLDDPLWSLEPGHQFDPRWSHRPRMEQSIIDSRHDLFSVSGRIYGSIRRMLQIRASAAEFDGQTVIDFDTHNRAVLGYQRPGRNGSVVLCLANFSDWGQYVTGQTLCGFQPQATLLQEDTSIDLRNGVLLEAHGWAWIRCTPRTAAATSASGGTALT